MKAVLKIITRITGTLFFVLSSLGGFLYFIDKHSWWSAPTLLVCFISAVLWWEMFDNKKCPTCSEKCKSTGVAGSKYKQWYCKSCKKTFWTTLFLENYEN